MRRIVLAALLCLAPACGWAQSGSIAIAPLSVVTHTDQITATANATIGIIPANASLSVIPLCNTTNNSVTVNIGTTPTGTELASGIVVAGNGGSGTLCRTVLPTSLSQVLLSPSLGVTIYISSASWNSASLNVTAGYAPLGTTAYGIVSLGGTTSGALTVQGDLASNGAVSLTGSAISWGASSLSAGAPTAAGTGAVPGDTFSLAGGTFSSAAVFSISATKAVSGTVAAAGSGGANGACTVTGTTGTGTKAQFTGTVSGGALTGPLTVAVVGAYTVNPTTIAAEPVTGCSLTGAQVNMVMGAQNVWVQRPGVYTVLPGSPAAQGAASGAEAGITLSPKWGPLAAAVPSALLGNGGGSFYIGGTGAEAAGAANVTGAEDSYGGVKAGAGALGSFNSAWGHNAFGIGAAALGGYTAPSGNGNSAFGTDCMRNVSGAAALNTCTGYGSLGGNASVVFTGSNNTADGALSGNALTTGSHHFLGGYAVGSTTLATGTYDVLIGGDQGTDTATAATSNAIGIGTSVKPGTNDIVAGNGAGAATTTDDLRRVLLGRQAGALATSASQIIAIGDSALAKTVTGGSSVAIGGGAGFNSTGGSFVGIGVNTGKAVTTMTSFAGFGNGVGQTTCAAGSNVLLLGSNSATDCTGSTESNTIHIGAGAADIFSATGAGTPATSASTIAGTLAVNGTAGITTAAIGNGASAFKISGAGQWSANGVVATTMTSLGPTGSHTTVQEWFTVTDSAGTVRYVPAY